jgi:hypothetical protein
VTETDLLARLRALPPRDLPPEAAARLGARAGRAFARQAALARCPALRRASLVWDRVLEPAGVTLVCLAQLAWLVETVRALRG